MIYITQERETAKKAKTQTLFGEICGFCVFFLTILNNSIRLNF